MDTAGNIEAYITALQNRDAMTPSKKMAVLKDILSAPVAERESVIAEFKTFVKGRDLAALETLESRLLQPTVTLKISDEDRVDLTDDLIHAMGQKSTLQFHNLTHEQLLLAFAIRHNIATEAEIALIGELIGPENQSCLNRLSGRE